MCARVNACFTPSQAASEEKKAHLISDEDSAGNRAHATDNQWWSVGLTKSTAAINSWRVCPTSPRRGRTTYTAAKFFKLVTFSASSSDCMECWYVELARRLPLDAIALSAIILPFADGVVSALLGIVSSHRRFSDTSLVSCYHARAPRLGIHSLQTHCLLPHALLQCKDETT